MIPGTSLQVPLPHLAVSQIVLLSVHASYRIPCVRKIRLAGDAKTQQKEEKLIAASLRT